MKNSGVDDEKVLVKGFQNHLESEGYQVETAYDGEAAVEWPGAGPLTSSSWI